VKLEGKVALVTGGTRGIGAAAALALARAGADLAIVGRYADVEARQVQNAIEHAGRRCLLIQADVGDARQATGCVKRTLETLGGVDVLVHAAGGNVPGSILELTEEAWYAAFDVHVHAIFHLCRAALPHMQSKREGAIVLVSSVAGIRGVAMNVAYQVVKGAIPQFTRALARMHADDNVRVNCVAPGIIRTRFHEKVTPEQRKHNLENRIPLHREGTPEQVAELILQLVTNDYLTGETFTVDGGLTMRIA
jgi:3-oxoacyl-[acyl-carrier protein] reductase